MVEVHETSREPFIATIEVLRTSFAALHALLVEFHELFREPSAAPIELFREPSRDGSCSERENFVSMACTADDTRLATVLDRTGFDMIHVESFPELLWIAMEDFLLSLLFLFLVVEVAGAPVSFGM